MLDLLYRLKQNIKKNFSASIADLKSQELRLKNGLNNKELDQIKFALKYLPDEILGEIQDQIDDLETAFKELKENEFAMIETQIENNETDKILKTIEQLKK